MGPSVIPEVIPVKVLSEVWGIKHRSALIRAKREGFTLLPKRVRGGYRYEVVSKELSQEDLEAIASRVLPDGRALTGFRTGLAVKKEMSAARNARRRVKEEGLWRYNTLSPDRKAECRAKAEILRMRDTFIEGADLPVKRGSEQFAKEIKAGRIELEQWIIDALPKRNGKPCISWPSLHRWQKADEESGLAGLASGHKPTKTTSVPLHMQSFIIAVIAQYPFSTHATLMLGLQARFAGHTIPGSSAVRRWVKRWKEDNAGLYLYYTNQDKWKNQRMLAPGSASEHIVRLNQLWEMDSTPADILLKDGRYTVIGIIDVYSRRLKLLVTPTSKAVAVAALLRRALLNWGVPEAIKTDNGKDYISRHIVRVIEDLEVDQILCRPFHGEDKPHIERALGTFSHGLLQLQPGYIGHNVSRREEIRAKQTFEQRMMNKDAEVRLRLTSDEFQEYCDRWVNTIYHQREHEGLCKQTPVAVARAWQAKIPIIKDERALDMLLCAAPKDGGMRVITKKLVKVDRIQYGSAELAGRGGESVQVLLDATDLGTVYLYQPNRDGSLEYLCKAINPDYTGISRANWAAGIKRHEKAIMAERNRDLRRIVREEAVENLTEEILRHEEAKIADIYELPKPSVTYTTSALDEAAKAAADTGGDAGSVQPIDITPEQEASAESVIRLEDHRKNQGLPATEDECYRMLQEELDAGMALTVNEERWMADWDHYLITGERIGLLAAGFQPFAERRSRRAAVNS